MDRNIAYNQLIRSRARSYERCRPATSEKIPTETPVGLTSQLTLTPGRHILAMPLTLAGFSCSPPCILINTITNTTLP